MLVAQAQGTELLMCTKSVFQSQPAMHTQQLSHTAVSINNLKWLLSQPKLNISLQNFLESYVLKWI